MGIYLSGVILCILSNFVRITVVLFGAFSTKTKNFKKINLYYDISTGGYSKEKPTRWVILFRLADMFLIMPLLSWVGVILAILGYIKSYVDKAPVPEKIKEVNFKLSSAELPADKVKECLNEIASFYGYPDTGFRTLSESEDDDPNEFVFNPAETEDDWYSEMQLSPNSKQYTIYTHSPDYTSSYTTLYEYKIENTDIYSRVIESKNEYYADVDYDIKDNVVLESDVREKMSKQKIFSSPDRIEEKLSELRKEVEWQAVLSRFKYFIMFRHSDVFKDTDLKKYFRSELERVKSGFTKLEQDVKELGGFIVPLDKDENTKFSRIRWNDNLPEDKETLLLELYSNTDKFNISYYELYNLDTITNELTLYLSKLN